MSTSAQLPIPVSVPDPFVAPLRDLDYLVQCLCETIGQNEQQVRRKLAGEQADCGVSVRQALQTQQIEPYLWSEQLLRFYETTDAFLYETVVWNRTKTKNRMRKWIARRLASSGRVLRVLTYGDGLGFDSLYLALAGHQVSYYEVSHRSITFARRIFSDHGTDIEVIAPGEKILPETFDAVICLDVLEHVPNPAQCVATLARALKPGGELIVHAPFWYLHPNVGTHLRSNRVFSGDSRQLYRSQGLLPVDADWFWNPIVLKKAYPGSASLIPRGSRLRLSAGGTLLKIARYWPYPFVAVARFLVGGWRTPAAPRTR